jgi:hypothetical protein
MHPDIGGCIFPEKTLRFHMIFSLLDKGPGMHQYIGGCIFLEKTHDFQPSGQGAKHAARHWGVHLSRENTAFSHDFQPS